MKRTEEEEDNESDYSNDSEDEYFDTVKENEEKNAKAKIKVFQDDKEHPKEDNDVGFIATKMAEKKKRKKGLEKLSCFEC